MATQTAEAAQDKPAKKGKKTLVIAVLAVVVVAAGAAGGVWYYMKSQAAHGEEHVEAKPEPVKAPAYLPMENMTINLADGDRFAQLGVTIELNEEKAAEKLKGYMPSIRNAVLLLASQRSSEELLTRYGKERLARDIAIEVARPLGFAEDMAAQIKEPVPPKAAAPAMAASGAATAAADEVAPKKADAKGEDSAKAEKAEPKKKKADGKEEGNPIRRVLFSSFIIQ